MAIAVLILLAGFIVLLKGAGLFVDGAARLARRLDIPPVTVGMTVAGFGTAVPEMFVNLAAAIHGSIHIALGNVVGSNIVNILLVLGIAGLIRPLVLSLAMLRDAVLFVFLSTALLWLLICDDMLDHAVMAAVSRSDGFVLLTFFGILLVYLATHLRPVAGMPAVEPVPSDQVLPVVLKMTIGFAGLIFGGRWVVEGAYVLAEGLAVPRIVMGLTVVALGTSLPELVTSVSAARRGHVDLAVGTVVGANLFNLLFVLGASAVIQPMAVNPAVHMDLAVLMAACMVLVVFLYAGRVRVMGRMEGGVALMLLALYLAYLFYPVVFADVPGG
jgi:cation:H+ antiporter